MEKAYARALVISPEVLNLIQDIYFLLLRTMYFASNKNLWKAVLKMGK
jgi:hypothetical protein